MRIGVPKEIKNHEYRVGMTPAAVRELTSRGHEVFVETHAGDGIGLHDEMYTRVGAKILQDRRRSLRQRRHDREGEGAAAGRDQAPDAGADALHLSPSRARSGADQGPARIRRDLHRLRDRDGCARRPAAARADERGRGPHVDPGRRAFARDRAGRPRHAARRRAGRSGGEGRRARRRRRRHQRRAHGDGPGGACHHPRRLAATA